MIELETVDVKLNSFEIGLILSFIEANLQKYPHNKQALQPLNDKMMKAIGFLLRNEGEEDMK